MQIGMKKRGRGGGGDVKRTNVCEIQHSLGHMPRYAFDVEGGHREGGGRGGAIILYLSQAFQ